MLRWLPVGLLIGILGLMAFKGSKLPEGHDAEILLAPVEVTASGVKVRVTSGGCTQKEDFRWHRSEDNEWQFVLERIKPDQCEALVPKGKVLEWKFADLGLNATIQTSDRQRLEMLNPIDPDRKHHG